MKNKFYLDIYSLPEIDCHEKIGTGLPFGIIEFNNIVEKLYNILLIEDVSPLLRTLLSISRPFLITNISNFIRLCLIKDRLSDGFEIVYTKKEDFNKLAGSRNLGQGYIADFFSEGSIPLIQPFLRGYFYNKKSEYIKKILSTFPQKNEAVIFNANHWVENYLKQKGIKYTKLYNSYFWKMKDDPNLVNESLCQVNEIDQLCYTLVKTIQEEFKIKEEREKYKLGKIILNILSQSFTDYMNCKKYVETKDIFFKEIYAGTCGSYLTRIVFSVLKEKNVKTNGFMHSGAISHIDYPFDPRTYIEYEIPDNFYVFNQNDIVVLQNRLDKFEIKTKLKSMDVNSEKITSDIKVLPRYFRKKIVYVSTTTPGGFQFFGVDDDIRKSSYENRLFEILENLGCTIEYKTHPKGIKQNHTLLTNKFKSIKIIESKKMDDILEEDNDIFIFKMVDSTAFNEVMKSNKPAIVVSENQEELLSPDARESLKNRVSFVDCSYENGLAVINEEKLIEALNREYTMDFEFANRFQ